MINAYIYLYISPLYPRPFHFYIFHRQLCKATDTARKGANRNLEFSLLNYNVYGTAADKVTYLHLQQCYFMAPLRILIRSL